MIVRNLALVTHVACHQTARVMDDNSETTTEYQLSRKRKAVQHALERNGQLIQALQGTSFQQLCAPVTCDLLAFVVDMFCGLAQLHQS